MTRIFTRGLVVTCLCLTASMGSQLAFAQNSQDQALPKRYIRVERNKDKKPQSLETAIVSFAPKSGTKDVTVDLVSAIHIGDREYFDNLNRLFQDYDVVLYEMVKPKDVKISNRYDKSNPDALAVLQRLMPSMLDLEFQVDSIDYGPENFVHADLTPKQLAAAMKKRGETGMSLFMKAIQEVLQKEWNTGDLSGRNISDAEILSLLTRKEGSAQLKAMLADQLDQLGPNLSLGGTLDSILIVDRNQAAMKELSKELTKRKDGKPLRIAIYYGAAHMPDIAKQLAGSFDMKPKEITWIKAWDMTRKPKSSALQGLLQLLQEVQ